MFNQTVEVEYTGLI